MKNKNRFGLATKKYVLRNLCFFLKTVQCVFFLKYAVMWQIEKLTTNFCIPLLQCDFAASYLKW